MRQLPAHLRAVHDRLVTAPTTIEGFATMTALFRTAIVARRRIPGAGNVFPITVGTSLYRAQGERWVGDETRVVFPKLLLSETVASPAQRQQVRQVVGGAIVSDEQPERPNVVNGVPLSDHAAVPACIVVASSARLRLTRPVWPAVRYPATFPRCVQLPRKQVRISPPVTVARRGAERTARRVQLVRLLLAPGETVHTGDSDSDPPNPESPGALPETVAPEPAEVVLGESSVSSGPQDFATTLRTRDRLGVKLRHGSSSLGRLTPEVILL